MKQPVRLRKILLTAVSLIVLFTFIAGFVPAHLPVAQAKAPAVAQAAQTAPKAKYIFLFIGDGMGVAQRNAAELYLAAMSKDKNRPETTHLVMNSFPAQGMTTTYDLSSIITDSASAGTALASGHKTISGTINMDPNFKEKYTTIAEIAKQEGWKIGIVSTVSLDHATPASFYAHQASRKNYYDIAVELAKSNFDYFAGGGFLQPTGSKGSYLSIFDIAKNMGYTYVNSRAAFDKLAAGAGKTLVINPNLEDEQSMNYAMDAQKGEISLADLTQKGIELLDNPTGFFMMVEGGKIDWSCHANDAAASIKDTLAFDDSIAKAVEFYKAHPDETLILVTGDHETGGLTIGFAGTGYSNYISNIQYQTSSYIAFNQQIAEYKKTHDAKSAKFEDMIPVIQQNFGLSIVADDAYQALKDAVAKGAKTDASDADKKAAKEASAQLLMTVSPAERGVIESAFQASMMSAEERAKISGVDLLYGGYEPLSVKLTTILNNKSGLGWTTYSHTGVPVMTSAIGVGAETFNGYYDNTDIFKKMMAIAGLD
jgi:alkaline phosphatase